MVPGVIAVVLLLLAALLLGVGWFGRTARIRPECSACRFCLDGLGTRSTCPECGADILAPGSRRVQVRRRRPRLLVAGLISLFVGLALAESRRRNFNWLSVLPLSVLEARASRGDPFEPSLDELHRRGLAGEVPPELLGRVIRSLLAADQGERAQNYSVHFDPFLSPADRLFLRSWANARHQEGLPLGQLVRKLLTDETCLGPAPPETLAAYLRGGVRPSLTLAGPPEAYPGEPLRLVFQWNWPDGGVPVAAGVSIPGAEPRGAVASLPSPWFGRLSETSQWVLWYSFTAATEPGDHEVQGTATVSLTGPAFTAAAAQDYFWSGRFGGVASIPPLTLEFPLRVHYRVNQPVPATPAEHARRALMRSIAVVRPSDPNSFRHAYARLVAFNDGDQLSATASFYLEAAPSAAPFDVVNITADGPHIVLWNPNRTPYSVWTMSDDRAVAGDLFINPEQKLPPGHAMLLIHVVAPGEPTMGPFELHFPAVIPKR